MEHFYHVNDHVARLFDGPQGREAVAQSNVYTILALLPVEADGRLRYRIKSREENFERIVTEDNWRLLSEADRKEWTDAVNEYFTRAGGAVQ